MENIENKSLSKLEMSLCSLCNNGYGNLVIGVIDNEHRNFVGINKSEEEVSLIIENSIKKVGRKNSQIRVVINSYDWGTNKIFIISLIDCTDIIYYLEDSKSYFIENGKVEEAKIGKIISKAEELSLLVDLNNCFDTIINLEISTVKMIDICDAEFVDTCLDKNIMANVLLGRSDYNVAIISDMPIRLEDSYSRLIRFGKMDENVDANELIGKEAIIINQL